MQQPSNFRADRHPSESYEDILEQDTRPVPDHLRQGPVVELGDEGTPVSDYFDPVHFAKEVRHVWLKVWQWACREEDIPEAGDFFVYENVGKSIFVVRQTDGGIKAFYNSCLHRGRRLVDERGSKSEFRCKYHGMAWTCAGRFKGNPIGWDFPQFAKSSMNLPEVKVDTWGGFVFINFDLRSAPLAQSIGPLADDFARYDFASRYKAVHVSKVVPCNWKVMAEAFMESHHTLATHPQIAAFLGDVNSQYDVLSDSVSRQFTATGVLSPMLAERGLGEMDVLKALAAYSDAGPKNAGDGAGNTPAKTETTARAAPSAPTSLADGQRARAYLADVTRQSLGAEDGWDYSSVSDAEMVDALLYNLFPHQSFWAGYAPNLVYRWRPNGLDPESSIMDVVILKRTPKSGVRPKPALEHRLSVDQSWDEAIELGALLSIFEQDMGNMPAVQAGLHTSGTGVVHFGLYSEMRIRQLHHRIRQMIAQGEAQSGL
jgi:phenylpropionate dioxygenase-like ring-hydroxylating dioxygenase large terminal subunit